MPWQPFEEIPTSGNQFSEWLHDDQMCFAEPYLGNYANVVSTNTSVLPDSEIKVGVTMRSLQSRTLTLFYFAKFSKKQHEIDNNLGIPGI